MRNAITPLMFLLACLTYGCAPFNVHLDQQQGLVAGDNYAFAIYTGDGKLLTHPLERFRQRQQTQADKPFSDVYVMSHGWNFTIPEAIAKYHAYIDVLDSKTKDQSFGREFRPFFIFIVWNSVTRPLTDVTRAVLPYGLDNSLAWLTGPIDQTLFFFPSVWKQSANAATIALGQDFPEIYRERQSSDVGANPAKPGCEDEPLPANCYGVDETRMGLDYPVSALLYDLFGEKQKSSKRLEIHVIGHSFGAKLAALSSMEAIRRWDLQRQNLGQKIQGEQCLDGKIGHNDLRQSTLGGDSIGNKQAPLESLLLINPAMNAREFGFLVDGPGLSRGHRIGRFRRIDTERCLARIPRKGLIYSDYDYPNGLAFDVTQMVLDNQATENLQMAAHEVGHVLMEGSDWIEGQPGKTAWTLVYQPMYGAFFLIENAIFGSVTWATTKLINFFPDLWYHVQHNNTFSEPYNIVFKGLRYAFNAVHFFVPLDRLVFLGQPADQLGLFRPTKPALGRGGLNKTGNGRLANFNVDPLQGFIDDSTDIPPEIFCKLSEEPHSTASTLPVGSPVLNPSRIYSFDASTVYMRDWYNLWGLLPSGAHGDIGSNDSVDCDPCNEPPGMEKREYFANFVFNFTKVLQTSEADTN